MNNPTSGTVTIKRELAERIMSCISYEEAYELRAILAQPDQPAAQAVDEESERAQFEEAILREWPDAPIRYKRDLLPPDDPCYNDYINVCLRGAWVGWKARAALAAPVQHHCEPAAGPWQDGEPPSPWNSEWFLARMKQGHTVVLRQLPEDYSYDYKTADETYVMGESIVQWAQLSTSNYVPPEQSTAAPVQSEREPVQLAVWYGPMPESNGKSNYTAILHRAGECIMNGPHITIERSEYPDRVRYEADRVRHIIGELEEEPDVLAYDPSLHSGYVKPDSAAPVRAVRMPPRRDPVGGRPGGGYSFIQAKKDIEWNACLGEVARLNGEQPTPDPAASLAKVADGSIPHVFNGMCPDAVEGHDSRDPDCPACQALILFSGQQ